MLETIFEILLYFVKYGLITFGILIVITLYGASVCAIEDSLSKKNSYLVKSPLDDTVLQLIGRVFAIPMYIYVLPTVIVYGIGFSIYVLFVKLRRILILKGVARTCLDIGKAIANFFNKKPLEFLKNYSVKIERRK